MTHRHHGKTTDERSCATPADALAPAEGSSSPAGTERERQMAQWRIGYDGRRYLRNGYRYDRLEDAVAYASLMGSRPAREDTAGAFAHARAFAPPTDAQRSLMASLGIRFEEGAYKYHTFRYDDLSDAVNYAKRAPRARDDERG
jgi:hypothetical protein